MEGVRQKLASLKLEENALCDKLTDLVAKLRGAKETNESLQYEIQSLTSSEALLKRKIESDKLRLSSVQALLLTNENKLLCTEDDVRNANTPDSNEDDLESEVSKKREELRSIEAQYDELVIHAQQVYAEKKRKEDRATALERYRQFLILCFRDVAKLESQHSELKEAWNKVESFSPPALENTSEDDIIDKLETRIKEAQQRLETADSTFEHSQREINRLDRLIVGLKSELAQRRQANELLKKEFDGICSELQSM